MVIVFDVFAHREDYSAAVEMDLGVACESFGRLEEDFDSAGPGEIYCFYSSAAAKAFCVYLGGLEHRGSVVMVRFVLVSDDKEDGLAANERIINQGPTLKVGEIGLDLGDIGLWECLETAFDVSEFCQIRPSTGIAVGKCGLEVLYRRAQSLAFIE